MRQTHGKLLIKRDERHNMVKYSSREMRQTHGKLLINIDGQQHGKNSSREMSHNMVNYLSREMR